MNILKSFKNIFTKTESRKIFSLYFLLALLGSLILFMPISQNNGVKLKYIDTLFISVSLISSTGLSPVSLFDSLSTFGGITAIVLMEIGGIGIVLLIGSFIMFIRKKLGIKETNIIAFEQNQFTLKNIFLFVKNALIAILTIQVLYIIIMSLYLYVKQPWEMNYLQSFYQSLFLSVSAFANAGFDIFPSNNSFVFFLENNLYFPQILTMVLIFLGGIGFYPLAESVSWIKKRLKKEKYHFSFLSKIFVKIHLIIFIISSFVFYLLEFENVLSSYSISNQITITTFMMISVRSAGFYNVDLIGLNNSTKFFMGILMFIGSAPNSSGGGIRLTTFILVISSIYSFGKNRKQTFINKKAIKEEAVSKAKNVFITAIILVVLSSFIILIIEDMPLTLILFEVLSAFGTVGLSLNVTPLLSLYSKLVLIIVMFIGRIGLLTFIHILENKKENINLVNYVETEMMIG